MRPLDRRAIVRPPAGETERDSERVREEETAMRTTQTEDRDEIYMAAARALAAGARLVELLLWRGPHRAEPLEAVLEAAQYLVERVQAAGPVDPARWAILTATPRGACGSPAVDMGAWDLALKHAQERWELLGHRDPAWLRVGLSWATARSLLQLAGATDLWRAVLELELLVGAAALRG